MRTFAPLVAEFIGTFALIFVGVLACAAAATSASESALVGVALAHGLTIGVMVSATAAVSGGHLNPAVSFGLLAAGKIDLSTLVRYWLAQLLGAVAGAGLAMQLSRHGVSGPVGYIDPIANGIPALSPGFTQTQGIIAEAAATFFLIFVVLGTAVDRRAPKVGGLFVGGTITLGILFCGPITGAAINPARWFGPAVVSNTLVNPAVWTVGPLLGGLLAGLVYRIFLDERSASVPEAAPEPA